MHTPSIPRRTLAATIALATGISLAACGTNSTEDTAPTETTTSEAVADREEVLSPPTWIRTDEIPVMAENGCSDGFKVWANQVVGFFAGTHDGNWQRFGSTFKEGPTSPRGHKTCEMTVTDLNISGTNGGDLNTATILVEALPEGLNTYDKEVSRQADKAAMLANGDVTSLNGLSDLVDDAFQYANTHDMAEGSKVTERQLERIIHLKNPSATSALAMYVPLNSYPNDTDLELETPDDTVEDNGFAVVTTDDEQRTDTQRSAAQALAYVFAIGLGQSGFNSEADFEIRNKP